MSTTTSTLALFPPLTPAYFLAFQFSSWFPKFAHLSIKSTVIRPLSPEFRAYLNADGVFVPQGSEDVPAKSALSDDGDSSEDEDEDESTRFAFPELDAQIRQCIKQYGAVFPKLNFSAPRDAAWVLPTSSPLRCTSPCDVYLLLKSSDFVAHDLSPGLVFAGCPDAHHLPPEYTLELVLRKWHPVDRSRELRCFVRGGVLLGIAQRDPNYYDFWNDPATRDTVVAAVQRFWDTHIKDAWEPTSDYTVDILLTRDLARAHIVDFNAYAPQTDPLLFTYEQLHALQGRRSSAGASLPMFKVVDSRAHPAAVRSVPAHQHNMVPLEALSLSAGRGIDEFAEVFRDEINNAMKESC